MHASDLFTLTVLHFDDETDSVSSIPVALLNLYFLAAPTWVNEQEVEYDDYLRRFIVRPPGVPPLAVEFRLVDNPDDCQSAIKQLGKGDIAIFDLMREDSDGNFEYVGIDLYQRALGMGLPRERLFVLTGFPQSIKAEVDISETSRLVKPIVPSEVAAKIVALFSDMYRPRFET